VFATNARVSQVREAVSLCDQKVTKMTCPFTEVLGSNPGLELD
jgi:hypothetical protein